MYLCRITAKFLVLLLLISVVKCEEEEDTESEKEPEADHDEQTLDSDPASASGQHILVLGGNGFMGASTVQKLFEQRDKVTIVNRGNWYWDSKERIKPHVTVIHCDRKQSDINDCKELTEYVKHQRFDAVIDFSALGGQEISESVTLVKDSLQGYYVLISSDAIYDVCAKSHNERTKETDAVRPEGKDEQSQLNYFHETGHKKMMSEEVLITQRQKGGFPYVILRLPDVIGPRDTTYRWWIYHLWVKLSPHLADKPVAIPEFLQSYPISLVYVEDVARVLVEIIGMGPEVSDQVFNLAWPQNFTVEELINEIKAHLNVQEPGIVINDDKNGDHLYFYPTVRRGPMDVSKAEEILNWKPTDWHVAVKESVTFYETAFKEQTFAHQRDEIIQIVGNQIYKNNKSLFYTALEELYDVELHHFTRDEL